MDDSYFMIMLVYQQHNTLHLQTHSCEWMGLYAMRLRRNACMNIRKFLLLNWSCWIYSLIRLYYFLPYPSIIFHFFGRQNANTHHIKCFDIKSQFSIIDLQIRAKNLKSGYLNINWSSIQIWIWISSRKNIKFYKELRLCKNISKLLQLYIDHFLF